MALDNVTSHFSTMLKTIASASFLSSLSIIHDSTDWSWIIAEHSRARSAPSRAPWVRKFVKSMIQGILVPRRKSSVGTSIPSCKPDEIWCFKHPRVSAVNRIASRPFRDKKTTTKADSFFRLNFNVYIDVDNRQRARTRDKNQRRPISSEEKRKNFIAAVRKRGNASCH